MEETQEIIKALNILNGEKTSKKGTTMNVNGPDVALVIEYRSII